MRDTELLNERATSDIMSILRSYIDDAYISTDLGDDVDLLFDSQFKVQVLWANAAKMTIPHPIDTCPAVARESGRKRKNGVVNRKFRPQVLSIAFYSQQYATRK